jgi:CBS domain-containing protein
MSVGKICVRTVITARPDEPIDAAARRMWQYNVGTLVILEGKSPIGIVTDRDLVIRVMAQGKMPQETTVRTVMSSNLVTVLDHTPLEDAMNLMRGYQIRRLVVVNDKRELVGIFTLDDMLELLGEEQTAIAGLLRSVAILRESASPQTH